MRKKILGLLYQEKDFVSGEDLSKKLGISRVGVWKHIQVLRKEGYVIEASNKGYRLISAPDLLLPEELAELDKKVYYFEEVSSTMDVARKLAQKGEEAIVIAETQTKGKGRRGRYWHSGRGGIYFSLILKPTINPSQAHLVNLLAGVAVAITIRKLFNINATLKWPNDVLINEKKVCGILAEMEAEADIVRFIILGIGINVNNNISDYIESATSLKDVIGKEVSKKKLFLPLIKEIEKLQSFLNQPKVLVNRWKWLSSTLGRYVRVIIQNKILEGEAIDIDNDGALILKTSDEGLKRVVAGDCIHLR